MSRREYPITLSPADMDWASDVGRKRMLHSLLSKGRPRWEGKPGEMWSHHILGAGAELAVARLLGVEWPATIDTFTKVADVGRNIEVRNSPSRRDTKVSPKDPDTWRVVGVAGVMPDYRIVGWIRAKDAKKKQWYHDATDPPCYFVPHSMLLEMKLT